MTAVDSYQQSVFSVSSEYGCTNTAEGALSKSKDPVDYVGEFVREYLNKFAKECFNENGAVPSEIRSFVFSKFQENTMITLMGLRNLNSYLLKDKEIVLDALRRDVHTTYSVLKQTNSKFLQDEEIMLEMLKQDTFSIFYLLKKDNSCLLQRAEFMFKALLQDKEQTLDFVNDPENNISSVLKSLLNEQVDAMPEAE